MVDTNPLHQHLASLGRALAAPVRIAILEVLAQAPRSVEELAGAVGQTVANTSQHLRILREARLVEGARARSFVTYRLAGEHVAGCLVGLRELGEAQIAELRLAREAIASRSADVARIDRETLRRRLRAGEVVLIDVRPPEEYAAAHLPGAVSVPGGGLDAFVASLPKKLEIVAYCRGPYCMLAVDAVRALQRRGRKARRFEDGVAEWQAAGLPLEYRSPASPHQSERIRKEDRNS